MPPTTGSSSPVLLLLIFFLCSIQGQEESVAPAPSSSVAVGGDGEGGDGEGGGGGGGGQSLCVASSTFPPPCQFSFYHCSSFLTRLFLVASLYLFSTLVPDAHARQRTQSTMNI